MPTPSKNLFALVLGSTLFGGVLLLSQLGQADIAEAAQGNLLASSQVETKTGDWSYCQFDLPENSEYAVELLSVESPEFLEGGELFTVTMRFQNTGNVRLLSAQAECDQKPMFNLGTTYPMDRESMLAEGSLLGWLSPNRIAMKNTYADPGENFEVQFISQAPKGDDIHLEFFQPVVEGVGWIGEPVRLELVTGHPGEDLWAEINYVSEASVSASQLIGQPHQVEIDISEQKMLAKIGDHIAWSMPISSGAYSTPTPMGTYNVLTKSELHISGEPYYYRMPYWIGFHENYGLHGLPWLGTEDGLFWQEAQSNIGTRASHGCVRTLPDDSERLYEFLDYGDVIWIHP